jgi:hypothetical protein
VPYLASPGVGPGNSNAYRAFDTVAPHSDVAAAWYTEAFSRPPWKVLKSARGAKFDVTVGAPEGTELVYICIEASRSENGGERMYFWTFLWSKEGDDGTRVIVETPDRPSYSNCEELPPWP